MGKRGTLGALALTMALGAAWAASPRDTSPTYAYATYKEERGPLVVIVDGLPASFREREPYIPVAVAVGVRAYAPRLLLTPESFVLVDPSGRAYPAAPHREVLERYPLILYDERWIAGRPVVAQKFALATRRESRFYPSGSDRRVERVFLQGYDWFRDVIYFPRPPAGLGGVLTLRVAGGGVEPPLEVRFRVPLPGVAVR